MASTKVETAPEEEIDDSLYSRQRYVLGDDAMKKLSKANVFIQGMGALGIEIAKNIVLSGVKSVTIQDTKIATESDLGLQFFLRKENVEKKRTREDACLKRLAELNPHVSVECGSFDLNGINELGFLKEFQCVVLTECPLEMLIRVNEYCHEHQIKFIAADVFGLLSSIFCDFGNNFEVTDVNGSDPSEFLIGDITKGNPAVITTLDLKRHLLGDGDTITLKEVNGMTELNGKCFTVKFISPSKLSIDCDTTNYKDYKHGGIAQEKKQSSYHDFKRLEAQIKSPDILIGDYLKFDSLMLNFVTVISLYKYLDRHNFCQPAQNDQFLKIAESINEQLENQVDDLSKKLKCFSEASYEHQFPPLCASLGGIAAQEVLKSVTGKFTPLMQWLLLDAAELCTAELGAERSSPFHDTSARFSSLEACIGKSLANDLANTKLFLVGCGAIGCEMLKNFALLGIGTGANGQITITDNDLIEKSNLNRQFLFRERHIQKPKSVTAAISAKEINEDICIVARQDKVCPATEHIFTDGFFENVDIVVNALDNIEARRYVDSRCVVNRRPLIETGTLGPRGHVQVILPYKTESYSNMADPEDQSIPYCTLKSFPQSIDHTIQWARDKFGSCFTNKPMGFNKIWEKYGSVRKLKEALDNNEPISNDFVPSMSFLRQRPRNWYDCVKIARMRFEKYFNHKAKQLLHVFPVGTILEDGTLFWQSPKRPPIPLVFDAENETHIGFVESAAKLIARIYGVKIQDESSIKDIVSNVKVPEFHPSKKKIIVDDKEGKPEDQADTGKIDSYRQYLNTLVAEEKEFPNGVFKMQPEAFEKDDDSNSHIDFITAASNLRAEMYNIEPADRYKTKRIAGNIIPAIATTTAAIAGLATVELVKVIAKYSMEKMRNCYLNLAIPIIVSSTPLSSPETRIRDGLTFTIWDRWDVHGGSDYTLQQFIHHFKEKFSLDASMVMEGTKIIFLPCLPGHDKKPKERMIDLLKPDAATKYVDLTLGFESAEADDEELPCPPVRYYFV